MLTAVRPALATIWVRVETDWPAEIRAEAEALAELNRCRQDEEQGRPVAVRPGTGPDTVVLDPQDDVQFALAVAVAQFSPTVEAMARDGALVIGRGWTDGHAQLRLTAAEWAQLSDLAATGLLVERVAPEPEHSWSLLLFQGYMLYVAATRFVWDSIPDLALDADRPAVWAAVKVVVGVLVIVLAGPDEVRGIGHRLRG